MVVASVGCCGVWENTTVKNDVRTMRWVGGEGR